MKAFIYRNLNRKGVVYSIKALEGPYKGKVVAYAPSILVIDVHFVVSECGRQRCLNEKRRNVHAGVVGYVDLTSGKINRLPNLIRDVSMDQFKSHCGFVACLGSVPITYNPYKYDSFVKINNDKTVISSIHRSEWAMFNERQVTASKFEPRNFDDWY